MSGIGGQLESSMNTINRAAAGQDRLVKAIEQNKPITGMGESQSSFRDHFSPGKARGNEAAVGFIEPPDTPPHEKTGGPGGAVPPLKIPEKNLGDAPYPKNKNVIEDNLDPIVEMTGGGPLVMEHKGALADYYKLFPDENKDA